METIKELYLESLRAPADPVNFQRDPYLREKYIKKHFGRTKEERINAIKKFKLARQKHMDEYEQRKADEVKVSEEQHGKRVKNAKIRRSLGFIDFETDENGNVVPIDESQGVDDPVMEELTIKDARYQKKVQETRERKKINIITPIAGVSKEEYREAMLRSDEYFKDVWEEMRG